MRGLTDEELYDSLGAWQERCCGVPCCPRGLEASWSKKLGLDGSECVPTKRSGKGEALTPHPMHHASPGRMHESSILQPMVTPRRNTATSWKGSARLRQSCAARCPTCNRTPAMRCVVQATTNQEDYIYMCIYIYIHSFRYSVPK